MLGHRGCRPAFHPRSTMQARHLRGGRLGAKEDRRGGVPGNHGSAYRHEEGVRHPQRIIDGVGAEIAKAAASPSTALSGRSTPRAGSLPARRQISGVLQRRHQRFDVDDLWLARRRGELHLDLSEQGIFIMTLSSRSTSRGAAARAVASERTPHPQELKLGICASMAAIRLDPVLPDRVITFRARPIVLIARLAAAQRLLRPPASGRRSSDGLGLANCRAQFDYLQLGVGLPGPPQGRPPC
jgi:hypothetical protein